MDEHRLDGTHSLDRLHRVFARQRQASRASEPFAYVQRMEALDALLGAIFKYREALIDALDTDFMNRSPRETQLLELFPLIDEIRYAKRHLHRWMRARPVSVNWQFLPGRAKIVYQPLGVVGVIGAWNYQVLLSLSPLVNALAAGNRVIVKPSELAPATAAVIQEMIAATFVDDHVAVVNGGAEVAAALASLPFDHILFTGSSRVGKLVMKAAAENLTPVTLELGGKSPALVHASFPMDVAADRICSAKFWNAGQTCVAPDYALVPDAGMDEFLEAANRVVAKRYPRLLSGGDYTRMINETAWLRMQDLVDDARSKGARVVSINPAHERMSVEQRTFAPTLVVGVNDAMRLMQEEIFGPILPIVAHTSLDDAIAKVNAGQRPLALYYFDANRQRIEYVLRHTVSGGVTVNDCIFHLPQHALPFGGIGASGMGAYHGLAGFETFSTRKGVLFQHPFVAFILGRLSKPPYGQWSDRLIDFLLARRRRSLVRQAQ